MDFYPEDLLAGVNPLVFGVNAFSPRSHDSSDSPKSTIFDRFLDAFAASLSEEEVEVEVDKRRAISLFRSDSDDDSDDDDHLFFESMSHRSAAGLPAGIYSGFGRRNVKPSEPENTATSRGLFQPRDVGYKRDFFSRARIEAISVKGGFPPSKDPEGTSNITRRLHALFKARNHSEISNLFAVNPLEGIIPEGWLAKHVHALPSVILVICGVTTSREEQEIQDHHLRETIGHLLHSLAPKRKCPFVLIGMMQDDVSPLQGDVWSSSILSELPDRKGHNPHSSPLWHVSVLSASRDLQADDTGMPSSPLFKQTSKMLRNFSFSYYAGQARLATEKLKLLQSIVKKKSNETSTGLLSLLPLLIRQCFKIAVFYDFLGKEEKSVRFLCKGYKYCVLYFAYISRGTVDPKYRIPSRSQTRGPSLSLLEESDKDSESVSGSKAALWHDIKCPEDMVIQCLIVADWFNLKIISSGLAMPFESGWHGAAEQWRQHCITFCSRKWGSTKLPDWFKYSYIARQRLVSSQLIERHQHIFLGVSHDKESGVSMRFSPWRTYESAAEGFIRLMDALKRAQEENEASGIVHNDDDPMRPRYVGGWSRDGLMTSLHQELNRHHKDMTLECLTRAISLYENELEKEKRGFYAEDRFNETSSSRTGARLYYLAGGILFGMGRHQEAVEKLSKAAKYSAGWQQLELAIRRMLIEAYEKHIPSRSDSSDSSDTLASMILDSYFNAQMSPTELRRALHQFSTICGRESLRWFHESVEDDDDSLPFSFAVSFPEKTHAVAGDPVHASVFLCSNLDYAVHINSVVLLSLAGDIDIPQTDLIRATNASEGTGEGIILQAKTVMVVSTEVKLPNDLSMIAYDDSGNGGEQQGIPGKGSFAKSARPRTAGITAAGGARLICEDLLDSSYRHFQGWNPNFLGGKPLRCDGIRITFYPVQAEKSLERVTLIELAIKKTKPCTDANIKRTPFQEENYIASAWSRPHYLPLSRGPRSLRVSGPVPHLTIHNLTEEVTGGRAVEGTVNRIVLKLQAGRDELCSDVRLLMSCFSVLVTPAGVTKRLVGQEELTPETDNLCDMRNPLFRTPLLVHKSETEKSLAPNGCSLPEGWTTLCFGREHAEVSLPSLARGECTYAFVDIYRPGVTIHSSKCEDGDGVCMDEMASMSTCKTEFFITVLYRQERSASSRKEHYARRRARRPTKRPLVRLEQGDVEDSNSMHDCQDSVASGYLDDSKERVSLEYTGSLQWTKPFLATFSEDAAKTRQADELVRTIPRDDVIGHDGDSIGFACTLQLDRTMNALQAEIASVSVKILASNERTVLFSAKDKHLFRKLSMGCKFSVPFRRKLRANEVMPTSFGVVEVQWQPAPLMLPAEVATDSSIFQDAEQVHGPLILTELCKSCFAAPKVLTEKPVIEAYLASIPRAPVVANPFSVDYEISNRSSHHQKVTYKLFIQGNDLHGLLLCGPTSETVSLGPHERRKVRFTLIAQYPGATAIPTIKVSSSACITGTMTASHCSSLFVLP